MPGIPEVFRMKLPVVVAQHRRAGGRAFVSRAVYTKIDEGDLKPLLDRVVATFPDVGVGSYPKWQRPHVQDEAHVRRPRRGARARARATPSSRSCPPGEPQRVE